MILFFFLLGTVSNAKAQPLFDAPCKYYNVPKPLVMAIAKHESDMNPWAVNIAGKSFMPTTKKEAFRLIQKAWRENKSFDVGLMQVNVWWLKKLGISPYIAITPQNNIVLGTYILSEEIKRHGFTWKAVGAYHSPNTARQRRYAYAVSQYYKHFLPQ